MVYFHLQAVSDPAGLPHFGGTGVDLFFVISGFIMVRTTMNRPTTSGQFLKARLVRIAPLYWLLTAATFAAAVVLPTIFKSTSSNPRHLLLSLLFVPFSKAGGFPQPVLFVGWTLNLEMFFYVLFAAGLRLRPYALGVGAVIVAIIAVGFGRLFFPAHPGPWDFYCRPLLVEFAMGMAIGLFVPRKSLRLSAEAKAIAAVLAMLSLALVVVAPIVAPGVDSVWTAGFPSAGAVAALVILEEAGWVLTSRLAVTVGNASYSVYLSHPYVTEACTRLQNYLKPDGVVSLILVLCGFTAAVFGGWTVYRFIESPITNRARATFLMNSTRVGA